MADSTPNTPWTDNAGRHFFDRFWAKVDVSGDCWEWQAALDSHGYGMFKIEGRNIRAHVVAWEQLVGPIREGLVSDHLCRNPLCVNPDHLEPVTQRQNTRRGYGPAGKNARKTRCKRGHPFTPDNVLPHPRGRACRACATLRSHSRRRSGGSG